MGPRVSVIVPAFNAGNYLRQAIDSVLRQTFTDFEIIVVNDGSSDRGETRSIALSYGARVRYIEQPNRGVGGALNTGIEAMQGEFFAWLSHDDLFVPEKLERQVAEYDGLGRRDAILYSNYSLIDHAGAFITNVHMEQVLGRRPELALLRGCINGCTVLIPREAFDKVGRFDPHLRYVQDYDLWRRMRKHYGFVHQPEILVQTRQHAGQGSHHPRALAEGNAMWREVMQSYGLTERALVAGSNYHFLRDMEEFLDQAGYRAAAISACNEAASCIDSTLVTVVIPFLNEVDLVMRAVESVQAQTHRNFEVLLVCPTQELGPLWAMAEADPRIRIIQKDDGGAGAARNLGMEQARGEYIALLDADDVFLPTKIETQLRLMQEAGAVCSHTSFLVTHPNYSYQAVVHSGRQTGQLYPQIVGNCRIATPCAMMHRALIDCGFRFLEDMLGGEDTIFWAEIASEHEILGIDEPLSLVAMTDGSFALDLRKAAAGLSNIRARYADQAGEVAQHVACLDGAIALYTEMADKGARINESALQNLFRERHHA